MPLPPDNEVKVFLTGATGFIGAFLIRDLMVRGHGKIGIVAHVRAQSEEEGFRRLRENCEGYGVWDDSWLPRIQVVLGSLGPDHLGIPQSTWNDLASTIDVVIHNGARVNWVHSYTHLRKENVLGTQSILALCNLGKPKTLVFVSSASVLDTAYYMEQSQTEGLEGTILEVANLEESKTGLPIGYAQTKWVSEQLVTEAIRRGLQATIVRPGYVVGDSSTGVSNTDDFIFRLLKGCLQLKLAPTLHNTLNMVPVDYAARIITASAFHAGPDTPVVHVTGRPCSTFAQVFSALNEFGFDVDMTDYNAWCGVLRRDFAQNSTNALYPLQHFVLDNLQQRLQAPILDNRNAAALLLADRDWTGEDLTARNSVTTEDIGKYLAYLVCTGFLDAPTQPAATALPSIPLDLVALKSKNVGGRGGHG